MGISTDWNPWCNAIKNSFFLPHCITLYKENYFRYVRLLNGTDDVWQIWDAVKNLLSKQHPCRGNILGVRARKEEHCTLC